ncbi:MAG: hypothetical protein KIT17_07540 [Rubrivivax sp.]|nr:hypothetical protein [Rubrivivax sp.]
MNARGGGHPARAAGGRVGLLLAAGLAAFACLGAHGEEPKPLPPGAPPSAPGPAASAPAPAAGPAAEPALETAREAVRSGAEWLARSVDSWFGDLRFEQGGSVRDGRLSLALLKRESETLDQRVRFDARLRLPNVERNAYVFIGRGNEREGVVDRPGTLSQRDRLRTETDEQQSFFGGLGVTLRDLFDFRIGVRGALRVYAQARYREAWSHGEDDLAAFSQTFFWTVRDQVGSTTALSLEHAFGPLLTVRWLGSGTITRREEELEWFTLLGAYRGYGEDRLLALEGLATGVHGAPVDVADYGVRVRWQQPVLRRWLIGEVILGHFWPRPDPAAPRGASWALGVSATMRF